MYSSKRYLDESDSDNDDEQSSKRQRHLPSSNEISLQVAQHYNNVKAMGKDCRHESEILQIRNFNNGIKSHLISESVKYFSSNSNEIQLNALDIACGKGGDLFKWRNQNVSKLVCVDIAEVSLDELKRRYNRSRNTSKHIFECEVIQADCTRDLLRTKYENPDIQFDIVSCQFAFHYCFESYEQLKVMLRNVSENLKVGGLFIGTLPNDFEIMNRLKKSGKGKIGNDLFELSMDLKDINQPPLFGAQYLFKLKEAVDCPEFLVYFPLFCKIASHFNLKLVKDTAFDFYFYINFCLKSQPPLHFYNNMLTYYSKNYSSLDDNPDLEHVADHFKTKRSTAVSSCTKSAWDVITLYKIFVFKKISD